MVEKNLRFLTLIRHAKSSWDNPRFDDRERPLAPRGLRDAPLVARHNKELLQSVEKFYCSSAKRAQLTLDEMAYAADLDNSRFHCTNELYTFDSSDLLAFLSRLPDSQFSIALIGHNPAFTQLTNRLTATNLDNIPTAGIVRIRLVIDSWQSIDEGQAKLVYYTCPKNYRSLDKGKK